MLRAEPELFRARNKRLRGLPEVTGPICRDAGVLRVAFISEHVASGRMAHLLQRPQRSNDRSQGVTQSVKWGTGKEAIPQVTEMNQDFLQGYKPEQSIG